MYHALNHNVHMIPCHSFSNTTSVQLLHCVEHCWNSATSLCHECDETLYLCFCLCW